MIKQTVQYTDFNDKNQTEVLYFNISKSELMDHLNLRDDLEKIQESLEGPERDLKMEEIQEILNLVKRIMRLAYGRRSADGLNFRKNDEIWDDFYSSAAYDSFIMSLFENPEKAFEFLVAVMPKDLMEQARREMGENVVELPQPARNVFENNSEPADQADAAAEAIVTPNVEKEWHEYSESELMELPQKHFEQLYNKHKGPKPTMLVAIAMKRQGRNEN